MPRATKGKAAKTVVKTSVTTGTAVAMLFLSASAAFAAAAFTKPFQLTKGAINGKSVDLAFLVDKPGVVNFIDHNTAVLQAAYINTGTAEAAQHATSIGFRDANGTDVPQLADALRVSSLAVGTAYDIDKQIYVPENVVSVVIRADYLRDVAESSESNNEMVIPLVGRPKPVAVTPPRITLSASSPAGTATPGYGEVLRFTIATGNTPAYIRALIFKAQGTDNARTQWPNRALNGAWSFYDTNDFSQAIDFAMGARQSGLPGATYSETNPSNWSYTRTFMEAQTPAGPFLAVPANTIRTYLIKVDTTGASSIQSSADAASFTLDKIYWKSDMGPGDFQPLQLQLPLQVLHY